MKSVPTTTEPKVSVCIVTYDQEAFIEQAVLSALEQQTDFSFEVIVGDDGSSDKTPVILKKLQAQYPERLRLVLRERNPTQMSNYLQTHNNARGEFVAHLDGDDFWLPGKLQRMHDALQANPDVHIAWHRVYIEEADGARVVGMPMGDPVKHFGTLKLPFGMLIRYYGVTGLHSASIYRSSARKIFELKPDMVPLDYLYSLSLCEDGFALYVDEVLGVYRTYQTVTTVTSTPGAPRVANALLYILDHYRVKYPQYEREICAQAIFQGVIRGWFGFKEWPKFFALARRTGVFPRVRDLWFIARLFMFERNGVKQRKLKAARKVCHAD